MNTRADKLLLLVSVITWVIVAFLLALEVLLLALVTYELYRAIDVASLLMTIFTLALIFFSRHVISQARVVTRHLLS